MTLNNIKSFRRQGGFTIVELLIVIIVIAILAAITVVAYNGVQDRARTTQNDSLAKEVANKAEVYAADVGNGNYPTLAQLQAATGTAALSAEADAAVQATTAVDKVQYLRCPNNGFRVTGWDYTTDAASTTVRTGGDSSGVCT